MSILPYILEKLSYPTVYDHLDVVHDSLDDNLMFQPRHRHHVHPYLVPRILHRRPWRLSLKPRNTLNRLDLVKNDENNFKVNLDVQQFKPDEVSVKVVNGYIVVDGKHEERSDEHGFISRQFTRRYKIPTNVDQAAITSTLSSDGVLSIGAPRKAIKSSNGELPVQVVQTNEPSVTVPQNMEKENEENIDANQ